MDANGDAGTAGPWTKQLLLVAVAIALIVALMGAAGEAGASAVKSHGRATSNTSGWTSPVSIGGASQISCTSSSFCAVVDGNGNAHMYNGSSWSIESINNGANLFGVSCAPTSSFCAAVGNSHGPGGDGLIYNGSWSSPEPNDPGTVGNVSCPTETFCMATAAGGNTLIYNGSYWESPVESGYAPGDISCPVSGFCVATDGTQVDYYSNGGWTQSPVVDSGGDGLGAISCPATNFCMAVEDGDVVIYNGSSWSSPTTIDSNGDLNDVSCLSDTFCMAVDNDGYALSYNGSTWSSLVSIDSPDNGLASVSCPSTTFCAATDYAGNVLLYTGSSPLTITTTSLPPGVIGSSYSYQLTASGGSTPYKWKKTAALPKGLKLSSTGLLSGIPNAKKVAPNSYPVSVQLTGGKGKSKQTTATTLSLSLSAG